MLVMRVPEKAIVKRKHRNLTITRRGRGYSLKELKDAGLVNNNIHIAINKGIPVDILRDTAHIENVDKLRPIIKTIGHSKTKIAENQTNTSRDKKEKPKKEKNIHKNTIKKKHKAKGNRAAPTKKV